ncbi:hypothetical protein, partial [Streptomyces sp. NRRL S-1521]
PVSAEQFVGEGGQDDALFGIDWVPVSLAAGDDVPTVEWADLEALAVSAELSDYVVLSCPVFSGSDPAAGAHEAAHWALNAVQTWLDDDRFAASRLVIATHGA